MDSDTYSHSDNVFSRRGLGRVLEPFQRRIMFDDPRLLPPPDPVLHVCPRCGKQAMKEVEQNHFHCFWCRFDRRTHTFPDDTCVPAIAVGAGVCLVLIVLL